ncbi:hypothetical protein GEMRC1_006713 [Eukaryota sp. GEM-RC1]
MTDSFSEDQVHELQEAFELFDGDGDGSINTKELRSAMRCLGQDLTEDQLDGLLNKVQVKENETIDFRQFMTIMAIRMDDDDADDDLSAVLSVFEHKGSVTFAELKRPCNFLDTRSRMFLHLTFTSVMKKFTNW